MGKVFEELSKDLASGVSRRQALRRFAAGIGAAIAALLTGRSAEAQRGGKAACVEFCRAQGLTGREFGECMAESARCPDGYCAMLINGAFVCVLEPGEAACVEFCRAQGLTGREFGECMAESARCPDGYCALLVNGTFVCTQV